MKSQEKSFSCTARRTGGSLSQSCDLVMHPSKQFTVKLGTIFEDSPIPLDKWLIALWMPVNCKNGISSYEVGRDLGITQESAWFVLQRLRLALQDGSVELVGGDGKHIEIDVTFIVNAGRFMRQRVSGRVADT